MSQDKPQISFSPGATSGTHSRLVLGSLLLRSSDMSKGGNAVMPTGFYQLTYCLRLVSTFRGRGEKLTFLNLPYVIREEKLI